MKIRVIIPSVRSDVFDDVREEVESALAPDCEISLANLRAGTASIESRYAESLAIPEIVRLAREAEEDGADGILLFCFSGIVPVIRETVSIPMVGALETSVLTALMLADTFSIITVVNSVVPMIRSAVREMGITEPLASIRTVDIPVMELGDADRLQKSLIEQSVKAIEEDGAEAIVLGCTGMMKVSRSVAQALANTGHQVPIINPATVTTGMLEMLIRNGLTHSRLSYFESQDRLVLASETDVSPMDLALHRKARRRTT